MTADAALAVRDERNTATDVPYSPPDRSWLESVIDTACRKIAPVWPLRRFVAVNPFLGFSDHSFAATSARLKRVAQIDMLMPRAFYREALADGTIADIDLKNALANAPDGWQLPRDIAALKAALQSDPAPNLNLSAVVATVAEVLDRLAKGDRQASRTAFMIDEISKWCAAYFDEGQAHWPSPWRGMPAYRAWREAARFDRNPEVMGTAGFRKAVRSMPDDPVEAIALVLGKIGIPVRATEDYLHRALLDIGGWAAYGRYLLWNSELHGGADDTLVQLLAIRVVWGYAIFLERTDEAFVSAWKAAMDAASQLPEDTALNGDPELAVDLLMQEAYEHAHQRRLISMLNLGSAAAPSRGAGVRNPVQAAFCIDVRSEVYRRSFELVYPQVETIGFAGFFGFPIEYVQIGQSKGTAQCPVLLKPSFVVRETVHGASAQEESQILDLRLMRRRAAKAWKAFKSSAVSSFTYVETAGLLFVAKLAGDAAGLTRAVPDPNLDGLDNKALGRIGPSIEPAELHSRKIGFDSGQRVVMAEAVLRAMSLTDRFARLVMLTGHGSTTVNNPHASGLDCGACGGHTGEANARVAAAILNGPDVRKALLARGISIPDDTWFLGCLHDTTTDEVKIFDAESVPASHAKEFALLRAKLAEASSLARYERAYGLGLQVREEVERKVLSRSRDWSQVRPEWGLAGNRAFIVAPRERTRGLDLAGQAFLHSYDWRKDNGFGILELIMTAPMVVASWINLQYYGSTANNRAFGSGNKVLHNVVGTLGVLEGNAGDLRVGLPWQSLHDGKRLVHEPLRLNVFIEAPLEAIGGVIAKHEAVRQLADNRWLHLYAIDAAGKISHRYAGGLSWQPLP
jgi:uncharacterized protein YbcC (UPF0753/DUF2309 family)